MIDEHTCEHAGHMWLDAGGGMDICGVCHRERLTPEAEPADRSSVYARCLTEALEIYTPEGARIFMQGANAYLDGAKPIDLVFAGEGDRVLSLLRQMTEGTPT